MTLLEMLRSYAPTMLPMHMPGGKRRFPSALPYAWDVTEVDGLDDLHEPHGILAEMQRRAAALWGAEASFVLVNGSTGGLLSAVRATGEGPLLLARNCHRSVYHAAELCRREVAYVLPEPICGGALAGEVRPEAVEAALKRNPGVTAAVVTSPTYEGVVSDLAGIAAVCHKRGVTLIADAAHGAHFGFHPVFPESAVTCGADIVVQSLHKTLPALTQTAVLHCRQPFAEAIRRENAVFESSSPSYLLLASADECFAFLGSGRGKAQMAAYAEALLSVRARLERELSHFRLLGGAHPCRYDAGKLVILTAGTDCGGVELAARLREEFRIETEMAMPGFLIAMTSVCDGEAELTRFADAVLTLDGRAAPAAPAEATMPYVLPPQIVMPPAEAVSLRGRGQGAFLPLEQAIGKVSLEYVWAYPPGIPLLVPGERVSAELLRAVERLRFAGISVRSTHGRLSCSEMVKNPLGELLILLY